jgi:AraC-like DNA-binding protein
VSFYRELAPSPALHALVACRWMRSVPADARAATTLILPDGCVDLIWRDERLLLAGPDRGPQRSPLSPGETILGLRLRPGVAGAVLGMPASEVLDGRFPLADVIGTAAVEIEERIAGRRQAAFEHLEALVSSRMDEKGPDSLVMAASRRLGFDGSRVDLLAEALGVSERQLRRRFHAAVGYGPKTLDRVLRFRRFLSGGGDGSRDLARLAAEVGYADQSHLTRECVRLSGLTPGRMFGWTAR